MRGFISFQSISDDFDLSLEELDEFTAGFEAEAAVDTAELDAWLARQVGVVQ